MKDHTFKLCVGLAAFLMAMTPAYAMPSFLNTIMSFVDANPEITTAYLDKTKYQLGDQMLITAEVRDDWGIERVQAQIENENGWDNVDMLILAGNSRKATWQGAWKVHDTLGVKEYKTKIIATDLSGQTAEKTLLWVDPVQSHPPEQIRAGTFQSGSYKFPGSIGIGTDATIGDRLKVKAKSGNAINAECTDCDAMYATSSGAHYSGRFSGGAGVKIDSGGLTVSSGNVCIGTDCRSSWPTGGDNLGNHVATQNLDMNNKGISSIDNIILTPKSSAPASPVRGQVYFDSSANRILVYNGSIWLGISAAEERLSGGLHTPSQCSASGGEIVLDGTEKFCRFNRTACPSTWVQYKSYTTTANSGCWCWCWDSGWTANSGSHPWSNTEVYESTSCSAMCNAMSGSYCCGTSCTATRTQIGCY